MRNFNYFQKILDNNSDNERATFAAVEQVLRFDISVGNIHRMEVLERSRDFVDDFRSFALRKGVFRSLLNAGKQLASLHALHHNQQDSRAIVDVFVNINNPEIKIVTAYHILHSLSITIIHC